MSGRTRLYIGGFLLPLLAFLSIAIGAPTSALAANQIISGTLTDSTAAGNPPIVGLKVNLERASTGQGTVIATATTDATGLYSFNVPAQSDYVVEENPAGAGHNPNYPDQFFASSTTFAGAQQINTTGGDSTGNDDSLPEIPGTVTGTVTDASDGAALSGVTVQLKDSGGNVLQTVTTNASGVYSVTGNPGSDSVVFSDDDFTSPSDAVTVTGGGTSTVNQGLTPLTGHITGLISSGGSPVQGASVNLLDTNGNGTGITATTQADGTFTLTGITTGTYLVQIVPGPGQNLIPTYYAPPNGSSGYSGATQVSVTNQVTTPNINAPMSPGGTIKGTITGAGGADVGGVGISVIGCRTDNCFTESSTATSTLGQFTITGLPTATYYLRVNAGGNYLNPQFFTSVGPNGPPTGIGVIAGQTATANDTLLQGGTITGKLVTTGGAPVVGEDVEAIDANGGAFDDPPTAADGTFTIQGLTPGTYKLDFSGNASFVSEFYGGTASSATATTITVAAGQTANIGSAAVPPASAGGRIAGTVNSAGGALSGVTVTLYDSAGHRVDAGNSVSTDQDGTYKTDPLLPGNYKVQFSAPSGNFGFQYYNNQTTLAAANLVAVSAGAVTPNVNATLSAGGSISGTVTDASNHLGVPFVAVRLLDGTGDVLAAATTQADGTYVIRGIPAGSAYHVQFDPSGLTINNGPGVLYATQFWNNKTTLASSDAITVASGASVGNINAVLGAASGVTTTTTPVTPPKTTVKAGKPKTSGAKLSGLGKRKASLKFTLTAGTNGAPKLKSFTIKLPKGLSFVKKGLKKGLKVGKGGKFSDKISGGALVVTLKGTASSVSVSLSSKALSVSKALATQAKKKKIKSLTVSVIVKDAKKASTTDKLVFKKPS